MLSKKETLKNKLLETIEQLTLDGGSGHSPNIPEYDYYAFDYLEFAELNLTKYTTSQLQREKENELIGCFSNLKRALDCQIECFLFSWNLQKKVKKANLGLDKKLTFLADIGLFSSRTITRFTLLRNIIEHEFKRPDSENLEAIFDLVTAFVSILQNAMNSAIMDYLEFSIMDKDNENKCGNFIFKYDTDNLNIHAHWALKTPSKEDIEIEVSYSEIPDFTYFFKVFFLLNKINSFASYDHIIAKL